MSAMWSASSRTVISMSDERAGAPLDQVEQPARGRDDDVDAAGEGLDLAAQGCAAEDGDGLDSDRVAERLERLADLHRELAGRHEDQGARCRRARRRARQPGEHGQAEAERLARAGLRAADDVATLEGRPAGWLPGWASRCGCRDARERSRAPAAGRACRTRSPSPARRRLPRRTRPRAGGRPRGSTSALGARLRPEELRLELLRWELLRADAPPRLPPDDEWLDGREEDVRGRRGLDGIKERGSYRVEGRASCAPRSARQGPRCQRDSRERPRGQLARGSGGDCHRVM